MNHFDVFYDESFLTSWGGEQTSLDLVAISGLKNKVDQSIKNAKAVLTTTSHLKAYENFHGLIFCYQDELLDVSKLLQESDKIFSIPSSLSDKEIENFVNQKIKNWIRDERERKLQIITKNYKLLKKLAKKESDPLKESEIKNIQKIEQTIKRKLLRAGTLPVLNRKLKYSILTETDFLARNNEAIDYVIFQDDSFYHLLTVYDDNKWLEKNSKFILILLDILIKEVCIEERDSFLIGVLENIPYPLVVISDDKEIYFSNKEFLSLNLSVSQVLKSSSTLRIDNYLYQVKNESFLHDGEKLNSYFFINQGLDTNDINLYNDLGIICSSLAHELKNPLAGVLAALNVLEITEALEDDAYDYLDKMKDTTLRAKKLVETFLGFSKFKIPDQDEKDVCMFSETAFHQASQLIKERVVETQANMQFAYSASNRFQYRFNESILLMTFYLIFNENLTHYQHNKLVKPVEGPLSISCSEEKNGLKLNISPFVYPIENHKLIKHLLSMQGLKLEVLKESYWITPTA